MSLGQALLRSLGALLSVVMLGVLLPGSAFAANEGKPRNYIVTLAVADSGKSIRPSVKGGKQRIRRRAKATRATTNRLVREHGFRTRHRYTSAVSGFSVRMTPQKAAKLRRDGQVARVRPARRFKLAAETVTSGVRRVNGGPGAATPDVDADIAIVDTGIGPVGNGELNVVGGINCTFDGLGGHRWEDVSPIKHGTHVAGTAAARHNGIGTVGVAPGARLWSVRVFNEFDYGDEATIICGLDWATSTRRGADAPPGTLPIDIINLSVQGNRIGGQEACGPGDPDLLHQAVCAAHAAGITVVAAAGNERVDASQVAPAGYDQVITVGALSDFDGNGWGAANSDCPDGAGEVDDTYASYSNYGNDIDIIAPGTCIRSTTTGDGTAAKLLTGTSMAAPHVTGAVARLLAVQPGLPPEQVRQVVRAAGRLDWKMWSDPNWSGVDDSRDPSRVLDVAALLGPPALKVWLSSTAFKVGGAGKKVTARVDVQRGGGYSGNVQLTASGLPASLGWALFDSPGPSLDGLAGLKARLRAHFKKGAPQGSHALDVVAHGSGLSGSRRIDVFVDRTPPKTKYLKPKIRGGNVAAAKSGAAQAYMTWKSTDRHSGVAKSTLQRKTGSRPWRDIKGAASSARVTLKPGQSSSFRVRARDSVGNASTGRTVSAQLAVRDSGSSAWRRPASGWKTKLAKSAHGGSVLMASKPKKSLATGFFGKAFAIIAPLGPGRGALRLRVDGGQWKTVSLDAPTAMQRRVVYSRNLKKGGHKVQIQGLGGQAAIDALLYIK